MVDIGRQGCDAHILTFVDICGYFAGGTEDGSHQCGHVLARIMAFQVSGLIRNHRITNCMG
jgi:hypothetical protein